MHARSGRSAILRSSVVTAALVVAACGSPPRPSYEVAEKTIAMLQDDLAAGRITSEGLVGAYLERIEQIDTAGPTLRSVLAVNPDAVAAARALDAERAAGRVRGPLHGVPILVKDNIDTRDPLPTTAGSLALAQNMTGRDAPAIARLREAGAIVLGKTNLSEWANIRSSQSTSGWSAVGGLTLNPYALDRNPCGSSAGSGAAVAASLAAAAIGTETNGSIVCPASINGIVGIKPTVGLISRRFIVPISHSQDTAGPMTRTMDDAAMLLTIMAGTDERDPATKEADVRKSDYGKALDRQALRGARLVVLRFLTGYHAATDAIFERALDVMKGAGAAIADVSSLGSRGALGGAEMTVLLTELKAGLNAYLESAPAAVTTRSLAGLIAFNRATPAEMTFFGQDLFERAEATKGLRDPEYLEALATARRLAGPDGIDRLLREHQAVALVAPTGGPAWMTDLITGDHFLGSASSLPAVAGYPHVTVPMGYASGLPVGVSFIGSAWSESRILGLAYAFEQAAGARQPPAYVKTAPVGGPPR